MELRLVQDLGFRTGGGVARAERPERLDSAMTVDDRVLEQAEEVLGYRFQDRSLLETDLTNASIADDRL